VVDPDVEGAKIWQCQMIWFIGGFLASEDPIPQLYLFWDANLMEQVSILSIPFVADGTQKQSVPIGRHFRNGWRLTIAALEFWFENIRPLIMVRSIQIPLMQWRTT